MKRSDYIGLVLLSFVAACRLWRGAADLYAERCYPAISAILSWPASLLPFSLEELVVVGFIVAFLAVLAGAIRRRRGFFGWLGRTGRVAMWLVVWLYMGWGNNYFRTPLYERLGVRAAHFEPQAFSRFLSDYTDLLVGCADGGDLPDQRTLERQIQEFYDRQAAACGYAPPYDWQHVKKPLLNPLYSAVGVLGWLGPFFCEAQVNLDLPDTQLPSTLAHELAHLAGVTGEGEANYWSYAFCRQSDNPAVRYSGCLAILPYVARNAKSLLPEQEYAAWSARVPQRAKEDTAANHAFWTGKRVGFLDDAQKRIMDLFLRSNRVAAGASDYQGVVGIIITMDSIKYLGDPESLTVTELFW